MAEIFFNPDCGNAPKAQFIRDLNTAFATDNIPELLTYFVPDLTWEFVGDRTLHSLEELETFMSESHEDPLLSLTVENIITHGKVAVATGIMKMQSGTEYVFCDVYTFHSFGKNAKIQEVRTLVVARS